MHFSDIFSDIFSQIQKVRECENEKALAKKKSAENIAEKIIATTPCVHRTLLLQVYPPAYRECCRAACAFM